jgi:hypothetical protein
LRRNEGRKDNRTSPIRDFPRSVRPSDPAEKPPGRCCYGAAPRTVEKCHKPTIAPHQIIHTSNPITSSSDEDRRLASIRVADFTKRPDARRRQRGYAYYLPGGKARAGGELACCRANMGMLPKGLRLRVALLLISMRGRNPVRRSAGEKEATLPSRHRPVRAPQARQSTS